MMKQMDMEVAGEFITMAAELMYIKSRMLLPKKEEEEDPRDALVRVLMEYKTAKEAAAWLSDREKSFAGRFEKDTDEMKPDKGIPDEMDIALLTGALEKLLIRMASAARGGGKPSDGQNRAYHQAAYRAGFRRKSCPSCGSCIAGGAHISTSFSRV